MYYLNFGHGNDRSGTEGCPFEQSTTGFPEHSSVYGRAMGKAQLEIYHGKIDAAIERISRAIRTYVRTSERPGRAIPNISRRRPCDRLSVNNAPNKNSAHTPSAHGPGQSLLKSRRFSRSRRRGLEVDFDLSERPLTTDYRPPVFVRPLTTDYRQPVFSFQPTPNSLLTIRPHPATIPDRSINERKTTKFKQNQACGSYPIGGSVSAAPGREFSAFGFPFSATNAPVGGRAAARALRRRRRGF